VSVGYEHSSSEYRSSSAMSPKQYGDVLEKILTNFIEFWLFKMIIVLKHSQIPGMYDQRPAMLFYRTTIGIFPKVTLSRPSVWKNIWIVIEPIIIQHIQEKFWRIIVKSAFWIWNVSEEYLTIRTKVSVWNPCNETKSSNSIGIPTSSRILYNASLKWIVGSHEVDRLSGNGSNSDQICLLHQILERDVGLQSERTSPICTLKQPVFGPWRNYSTVLLLQTKHVS
jgi:hypothetical protein